MENKKRFLLFLIVLFLGSTTTWAKKSQSLKRATFSMYCYWTGEATLGALPGVKKTKIGSLDHNEVVEVFYNPMETNLNEMVQALKKRKSFYSVLYRTPKERQAAMASIPKAQIKSASKSIHYIAAKHSLRVKYPRIYNLKLSEQQSLRLNSWAHFGGKMPKVLSQEQEIQLRAK